MKYVLRRLIAIVPVLLIVSWFAFLIPQLSPGDPARTMLGPEASQVDVDRMHHQLGLDRPLMVQYGDYLSKIVRGDLGRSSVYGQDVSTMVFDRLPTTLTLALTALIIGVVIAVPLGVFAAMRRGRLGDIVTMMGALTGVSTPVFAVGLGLIYIFSYKLGWLPSTDLPAFSDAGFGMLKHLVLPSLTLAVPSVALSARLMRSSMLDVLGQDYVRTAKAKGAGTFRIIRTHCLKNAMIPMVTVLGIQLGSLIGGAVVTETIFALPGVGRLAVDSIASQDYSVVQGVVLLVAVAIVVINLFTDLLYRRLDPRISLS